MIARICLKQLKLFLFCAMSELLTYECVYLKYKKI
jgi:hypothetical protein